MASQLDHIVVLLPHETLSTLQDRLKDSLTVAPGGTHANGITHNKLLLFQDGVYIELIAFFPSASPSDRQNHPWGSLPENTIVDFAYTLPEESDFPPIQERVHKANAGGIEYSDLEAGGRTREDGTVLKWAVAHAHRENLQLGELPFWCIDRTDRKFRVPYEGSDLTTHPSGVSGVSKVVLTIPKGDVEDVSNAYTAIHGSSAGGEGNSWNFGVPAGRKFGEQTLSLREGAVKIDVTLAGGAYSPSEIEIVPGLTLHVQASE